MCIRDRPNAGDARREARSRAEVAAEQAETEQLRLLVRVVVDHAIWVVLVSTSTLDRDTAAYYWLAG